MEREIEFPDRAVEPLRDGVGREVEAEDWGQGDATRNTPQSMESPKVAASDSPFAAVTFSGSSTEPSASRVSP
ncbi:hypothetical protein [Streptomyces sp. NPDC047043]|uniref:hypothetical protein n=1 Tax=Streptomyces sp. NPDC047043 TaxID=3154497 RepID=UPI0033F77DC5